MTDRIEIKLKEIAMAEAKAKKAKETSTPKKRRVATQPAVIGAGAGGIGGGGLVAALPPQWQWAGVLASGVLSYAVPYLIAKMQAAQQRTGD